MSTQIVDIPGLGEVEFPADMPDDKLAAEIQRLTAPPQQTMAPDAPPRLRDAMRRPTLAERSGVPAADRERFDRYADEVRSQRAGQTGVGRYVDTAVRGVARGVPFMDDIAAAGDAAIGRGEGRTFGERRRDSLLRQRALNAVDDEERPVTSYGGQFAGAVALPGAAVLRGASLPEKAGRAAGVGAAYGAASGFGAGYDVTDRFSRAKDGAMIGGGLGALIPVVGAGISKTAGGLGQVAQSTVVPAARAVQSTARGYRDAEGEALRRVRDALWSDRSRGQERLLPDRDWMDAYATGQRPVVADFGGETTRALGRSAANTSPDARDALVGATGQRFHEQGQRTADFLTSLTGLRADPVTASEAIRTAARTANKPLYDAAYAKGEALWGGTLEELTRSPLVQRAMREAETRANNRTAAFTDEPVVRNPFVLDEATGQMVLRGAPDGSYALPNLAYWDLVKRGLDDAARGLPHGSDERATAEGLARRLRGELDQRVPEYAQARGVAAQFFDVNDALEAGQAFARNRNPNAFRAAEFTQMASSMSPAERAMFGQGYAMEIVQSAMNAKDTQNVVTKIFASPEARRQIGTVLGPEQARQLEGYILRENIMDRLRTAVSGNSTTARQLQELGLAGGVGSAAGYTAGGDLQSASAGAIIGAALRGVRGKVDVNVSREVGKLLASDDPAMIDRALRELEKTPQGVTALRTLSGRVQALLPRPATPAAAPAAVAPKPPPATETMNVPKIVGNEAGGAEPGPSRTSLVPAAGVVAPGTLGEEPTE